MKRKTKHRLSAVAVAIAIMTSFAIGFGIGGTTQDPCKLKHVEPIGENLDSRVCEPVFYDGQARAELITEHQYINWLSEHTVIITDRSLDDVQQEILDAMNDAEVE